MNYCKPIGNSNSICKLTLNSVDRTMTGGTCPDRTQTRCTGTLGIWCTETTPTLPSTPGSWTGPVLPPWDEKIASLQPCIMVHLETYHLGTFLPAAWTYLREIYLQGICLQEICPQGICPQGICLQEICLRENSPQGTYRLVISCLRETMEVHCLPGVRCCLHAMFPDPRLGTGVCHRPQYLSETLVAGRTVGT